jgi:integrase
MTVKLRERMIVKHATGCSGQCGPECVQVQDGWVADIRVRLPSGEVFRERRRAPGVNRAAAKRWAAEREAHIIRFGVEPREEVKEKSVPTFDQFCERYTEHAEVNNKPSTAQSKRLVIANHLSPFFGSMRLDEITAGEVERFKAQQTKAELSAKSINNELIVLNHVLTVAVEWGELTAKPKVKKLKAPPPPFDFLNFEETERFLPEVEPEWAPMATVAVKTGLRAGELRALHWEDVDLAAARLTVRRNLWCGIELSPKGGRSREVDLCRTAIEALKAQESRTGNAGRYVFSPTSGDKPFGEKAIKGVVARACHRAGIERQMSWHALRHTFASHLVMKGVALKVVQELLGHATIDMTMRYAHLSPQVRREAVHVLDRLS